MIREQKCNVIYTGRQMIDRSAENPHSVMYKVKKAAEGKGQVQAGT